MANSNQERRSSATNMRLGQFIDALSACDPLLPLVLEDGKGIHDLMSYRGYYEDLAISPQSNIKTVGEVLVQARDALGEVFQGYKGGDFPMNKLSFLWVGEYGESGGNVLTSVEPVADRVVVKTTLHDDYK